MVHMKKITLACILLLGITVAPAQAEDGFFSRALAKARKAMQGAFQMAFLPKLPVVFHKATFNAMFDHTQKSFDSLQVSVAGQNYTGVDVANDKSTHVKKSAELALHIKSLFGSSHLAYGVTMMVGFIKEAIDGSFLNPNGCREKADLYADHVGAMAVFGQEKFDRSLQKHAEKFLRPDALSGDAPSKDASAQNVPDTDSQSSEKIIDLSPFAADSNLAIQGQ